MDAHPGFLLGMVEVDAMCEKEGDAIVYVSIA